MGTTMTPEIQKKMQKLIDTFYQRSDTEPFRQPVDWKGFGLTDYPHIIKHPMDLGTIQKRLNTGSYYKTVEQCAADVDLVWTNCQTYNADGSDFHKLAAGLQKKWTDKYHKLLADAGVEVTVDTKAAAAKPSLTERREFAKFLYTITKEDLGRILVSVEQKCPAAIRRNESEDQIEFNVDELNSVLLQELKLMATPTVKKRKPNPAKKTKTSK